jgi:hypothetical protein
MALAIQHGLMPAPSSQLEWLGSNPAVFLIAAASVLEILAYYVPFFDHVLDVAATPTAIAAACWLTHAMMPEMPPAIGWAVATVAGGLPAGVFQLSTITARGFSTALTGGMGNFIVASLEWIFAAVLVLLAIFIPVLGVAFAVTLVVLMAKSLMWLKRRVIQKRMA